MADSSCMKLQFATVVCNGHSSIWPSAERCVVYIAVYATYLLTCILKYMCKICWNILYFTSSTLMYYLQSTRFFWAGRGTRPSKRCTLIHGLFFKELYKLKLRDPIFLKLYYFIYITFIRSKTYYHSMKFWPFLVALRSSVCTFKKYTWLDVS